MTVEEAFVILDTVIRPERLNDVQALVSKTF
jgi:hypothetical protein